MAFLPIKIDKELSEHLAMAKQDDNNYRLLMISIDNEVNRMVMKYTMTKQADWKSDYQLFLAEKIDSQDNRPFFVLINIDLDDGKYIEF